MNHPFSAARRFPSGCRTGSLILCGLLAALTAPGVWAQQPIIDGHIYYYTGAATIATSLLGYDVVIGRAPVGAYGAQGDTNLTTPQTVTIAAGAQFSGNLTDADAENYGYDQGISVFNGWNLVVDSGFVHGPGGPVQYTTLYDNSRMEINGATNVASFPDANAFNFRFIAAEDSSQITVNGNVIDALYGEGNSQVIFHNGYAALLDALGSSHITMTGGTVANLGANGAATLDFQDGKVAGSAFIGETGRLNISGGDASRLLLSQSGEATITGGTLSSATASYATDNSTVHVKGGSINEFYFQNNSTLDFQNGIATSAINLLDTSQASIRGGSIGGPLRLLDTSFLNVYGNGLIITGQTPWSESIDGNLRTGIAYTVTGILDNNSTISSFVIYDQDSGYTDTLLNPNRQFNLINSGVGPIQIDSNIYYITAPLTVASSLNGYDVVVGRAPGGAPGAPGDIDLGTTDADKYTVNLGPGSKFDQNTNFNDGYGGVSVYNRNSVGATNSQIGFLNLYDSSTADLRGNTSVFIAKANNSSHLGINLNPAADINFDLLDSATARVNSGLVNSVNAEGQSVVDIAGGSVFRGVFISTSVANITGGTIGGLTNGGSYSGLFAYEKSTINMSDGAAKLLRLDDKATLNFTGGVIDAPFYSAGTGLATFGNSIAHVSGGNISYVYAAGSSLIDAAGAASIATIGANDHTSVNIGGAANVSAIGAADFSTLTINGGTIHNINLTDGAVANIGGGTTGGVANNKPYGLTASIQSSVNISGGDMRFASMADRTTLNISGGNVTEANLDGEAAVNVSDGTVPLLILNGESTANITGGQAGGPIPTAGFGVLGNDLSTVNISGGHTGYVTQSDLSSVTIGGNAAVDFAAAEGQNSFIIGGNAAIGTLQVSYIGPRIIQDSAVVDNVYIVQGGASAQIKGGTVKYFQDVSGTTSTVSGGHILIADLRTMLGSSALQVTGGVIDQATLGNKAVLSMAGGSISQISQQGTSTSLIYGGTVQSITALEKAEVLVLGGTVNVADLRNNSALYMFSGHLGTYHAYDKAHLYWYGGTIGGNTIYALGDTMTSLIADSYTLSDGVASIYNDPDSGIVYSGFFYDLSGFFTDGSAFSTHYFEATGDSTGAVYHPQIARESAAGTAAPEASSLALYLPGLALLGICNRRRCRRAFRLRLAGQK